jgi:hypothetical protein
MICSAVTCHRQTSVAGHTIQPALFKYPVLFLAIYGMLCLLWPGIAHAQPLKSYVPPAPNAAGLGTYGQIPISEYSGVPEIRIPLYSIETDGFKLPIAVSYHSGGFKVADEASWVGLGWSLNAGGVITRTKRHKDDFSTNGFYRVRAADRGCGNGVDQEPDIFYYNLGTQSGKFIITGPDNNNAVRSFTKDNLKFVYQSGSWILTTGEGIVYRFEKREYNTETTTETTNNDEDTEEETYISSWYLTSIQLVNDTRISFSYLTGNNTKISRIIKATTKDAIVTTVPYWTSIPNCCYGPYEAAPTKITTITTTINSDEVLPARIDFPNGFIRFTTSDRTDLRRVAGTALPKKLQTVQIYSKLGTDSNLLKTFSFSYDYYNSNTGDAPEVSTRLRLLSVQEQTPTDNLNPWTISYNSSVLPPKQSGGPNGYLGTMGLLQSIQYPTGGASIFEFETHPLPGEPGARIRKIWSNDGTDSLDVRRFEYAGGKMMGKMAYGLTVPDTLVFYLDSASCCGYRNVAVMTMYRSIIISADFSTLGETVNGYLVGYDKVTTWYGENGENGKKESFFENTAPADPKYKNGKWPVAVPLNTSNKNGQLKEQYEYKNRNGSFVPVTRSLITYTSADVININARRWAYSKCDWTYTITTEWIQKSNESVYTYDSAGANPIIAATSFFYDDPDNILPSRISTTNSKGQAVVSKKYYAKEKSVQAGGVYTTMLNRNMIDFVIDEEKSVNGVITEKSITSYKDWYNNQKIIKPETIQQKKGAANAVTKIRFLGYDLHANVTGLMKEGGATVSYVWGHNGAYPLAEAFNAPYSQVPEAFSLGYNAGLLYSATGNNSAEFEPFVTEVGQTYRFTVTIHAMGGGTVNGGMLVRLISAKRGNVFEKMYTSSNTYQESIVLPAGEDSLHFSLSGSISGVSEAALNISSSYLKYRWHFNLFHTSFEELSTGYVKDSKTGSRCVKGPYSIPMPWTTGAYILSWWQKPLGGSAWEYKEQELTLTTTNSANYSLGNNQLLLDEVRLYPKGAHINTYTYTPLVGMTGRCDERHQLTFYEYDGCYRLKLTRDNDRNILNTWEYNYKTN